MENERPNLSYPTQEEWERIWGKMSGNPNTSTHARSSSVESAIFPSPPLKKGKEKESPHPLPPIPKERPARLRSPIPTPGEVRRRRGGSFTHAHHRSRSMTSFPLIESPGAMAGNAPRQAPSPGPGPHQMNGVGGAALGMGGQVPHAGHQMDVNHLWNMVQELSAQLAENRAHVSHILNSVQQIQVRAAQEGSSPTITEVNGELQANRAAELATLHNQLSAANRRLAALETSNAEYKQLVADYENGMELILTKLRPYAYHHAQAINATKAHYNSLLEQEREANLQMRLQLIDWQAGLRRVNNYAREAFRNHNEATLPYVRRIAGLKSENRTLRRLAGWAERDDSSDEEEEREEERPTLL